MEIKYLRDPLLHMQEQLRTLGAEVLEIYRETTETYMAFLEDTDLLDQILLREKLDAGIIQMEQQANLLASIEKFAAESIAEHDRMRIETDALISGLHKHLRN